MVVGPQSEWSKVEQSLIWLSLLSTCQLVAWWVCFNRNASAILSLISQLFLSTASSSTLVSYKALSLLLLSSSSVKLCIKCVTLILLSMRLYCDLWLLDNRSDLGVVSETNSLVLLSFFYPNAGSLVVMFQRKCISQPLISQPAVFEYCFKEHISVI